MLLLVLLLATASGTSVSDYDASVKQVNWTQVEADIATVLTNSQPFWPADYGTYGPFMIRLAWHCAGSYRVSDGRGGCTGGRIRFDPERSWPDNTNLDKARRILLPVKLKHGEGLSWGDLIILAGNVAIKRMGGPVFGFCAGREDDVDGSASVELGPGREQEQIAPCPINGECESPLGPTTVGLIYVNPEGPMGIPDPVRSAPQIRDTFGRMDMTDNETVALIGGGHAFGKTHGACPKGAGAPPSEDPENPWPGNCETGKGDDAFTSGFEGPWTQTPMSWSNQFFLLLLTYDGDWEEHEGPGNHSQWHVPNANITAPGAHNASVRQPIMMLTSDVSLLTDANYKALVITYANNVSLLNEVFSRAWYKLTTRDMGPASRCANSDAPEPQPFQYPLPAPPPRLADFNAVRNAIRAAISNRSGTIEPDYVNGQPYYGALFVNLAFQCMNTFRSTDYLGGCNGARIRFSPQKDWPVNKDLDKALTLLDNIKNSFGSSLSWSDLIVLAGNVALDDANNGTTFPFCGGRTDASEGSGSQYLQPRYNYSDIITELRQRIRLSGLTNAEFVALSARPRSPAQQIRLGFSGSWTTTPNVLSNAYFRTLLTEEWEVHSRVNWEPEYRGKGSGVFMLGSDLAIRQDAALLAIAQSYAGDNELFLKSFAAAWTKLAIVDRFDGPTGNRCPPYSPNNPSQTERAAWEYVLTALGGVVAGLLFACCFVKLRNKPING